MKCDANRPEARWYATLRRILSHLQLALGVIIIVLIICDNISDMEFLINPATIWMVFALAVLTVVSSIMGIVAYWPKDKE